MLCANEHVHVSVSALCLCIRLSCARECECVVSVYTSLLYARTSLGKSTDAVRISVCVRAYIPAALTLPPVLPPPSLSSAPSTSSQAVCIQQTFAFLGLCVYSKHSPSGTEELTLRRENDGLQHAEQAVQD